MGLSKLSEKCSKCPFVSKCDNKRMEALAYLPDPIVAPATQQFAADVAMPMARETVERHSYGKVYTQYKDDLEKELYKALYSHLDIGLKLGGNDCG